MTECSSCKKLTLHQDPGGWFCLGCHAVGIGIQPTDLRERKCAKCDTKTFDDLCYMCWKKEKNESPNHLVH